MKYLHTLSITAYLKKKKAAKPIILVINRLREIQKVNERLSYQTTKVKMKIAHTHMKSSHSG